MRNIFTLLLILIMPLVGKAQNSAYQQYIQQYSGLAVEQMQEYKIPASITLAQGLLESAAGQSYLARNANNHFGIKVSGSWTGPYVLRDDDAKNEKFRKYKSARDSYIDHSLFLTRNKRYASLFELKITDYKGWARGLKACGYATSPTYAHNLIEIIERYQLYNYDSQKGIAQTSVAAPMPRIKKEAYSALPEIKFCNGSAYIVARAGDTYKSLAKTIGKCAWRLRRFNDAPSDAVLSPGDVVFLEKKSPYVSAELPYSYHTLRAGESLHSVAQLYGIQLKRLLHLNRDFVPATGAKVRLK